MNRAIPLLIILILLATTLLLLVAFISSASITGIPSEFLIAATIVSLVGLFGAAFSIYTQKRAKERIYQASTHTKR